MPKKRKVTQKKTQIPKPEEVIIEPGTEAATVSLPGVEAATVSLEVILAKAEAPSLLAIGQQVRIVREFKGPRGLLHCGTTTVIEGYQMSGDSLQYKILHRGLRFWVPGEIVEKL